MTRHVKFCAKLENKTRSEVQQRQTGEDV